MPFACVQTLPALLFLDAVLSEGDVVSTCPTVRMLWQVREQERERERARAGVRVDQRQIKIE